MTTATLTVADLEQQRAAVPDDDQLPASATQADLRAVQTRRRDLDARIRQARTAMATLAELQPPDPAWIAFLESARAQLAAELLAPLPDAATARDRGRRANLSLSIRCCDFGPDVLTGTLYSLDTTALGQLMMAHGYQLMGADPAVNFGGVLPWHGGLVELEKRAKAIAARRQQAQASLDLALMDDAERAAKEAREARLRAIFNAMRVRHDKHGTGHEVVVDGVVVDEASLTPDQREALAWFRATLAASAP